MSQTGAEEIDKFYNMLNASNQCKSQEIIILMACLNVKGRKDKTEAIGKYRLGTCNEFKEK